MKNHDLSKSVQQFLDQGFIIFENAIPEDLINRFEEEYNNAILERLSLSTKSPKGIGVPLSELEEEEVKRCRIIDVECHLNSSYSLILNELVVDFLKAIYQQAPTCIQTLTYRYSSQQGEHSDYYLVNPPWAGNYDRDTLIASWIAFEASNDENGALIIYPGSHKIQNKKTLKNDFDGKYQEYVKYLINLCSEHGIKPERFYAKRGDILFWHGDFIHAGGKILDPNKSRFSLVSHYASIAPDTEANGKKRKRIDVNDGYLYIYA